MPKRTVVYLMTRDAHDRYLQAWAHIVRRPHSLYDLHRAALRAGGVPVANPEAVAERLATELYELGSLRLVELPVARPVVEPRRPWWRRLARQLGWMLVLAVALWIVDSLIWLRV